jgi:hypothetical protein
MSAALERVRKACMALDGVSERLSHGAPAWFAANGKQFAVYVNNHHGDGRLAVYCAAPDGLQEVLVDGEPEYYFRPPYYGHRGWIGVHLDHGLPVAQLRAVIDDAYDVVMAARKRRS